MFYALILTFGELASPVQHFINAFAILYFNIYQWCMMCSMCLNTDEMIHHTRYLTCENH